MKRRTRNHYTDAQKAVMWARWKEGWTLHQIAHLFDRAHSSQGLRCERQMEFLEDGRDSQPARPGRRRCRSRIGVFECHWRPCGSCQGRLDR